MVSLKEAPLQLALDSSTSKPLAALLEGNRVLGEWQGPSGTQHSETLLVGIQGLMRSQNRSLAELDFISVGIGPGMFTGLRIGVACAQFLADSQGKKIAPVSSLLAVAFSAKSQAQNHIRLWALSDAKSQRVYACDFAPAELHENSLPKPGEEVALTPQEAAAKMQAGDALTGEAAPLFATHWPTDCLIVPAEFKASSIGLLALRIYKNGELKEPKSVQPVYLKTGQAHL